MYIRCVFRSWRCMLEDYTPDVVEKMETTFTVGLLNPSQNDWQCYFIHGLCCLHMLLQYSNLTVIAIHYRGPGVVRMLSSIRQKLENLSPRRTSMFIQNLQEWLYVSITAAQIWRLTTCKHALHFCQSVSLISSQISCNLGMHTVEIKLSSKRGQCDNTFLPFKI